jgi:hypothetical protein
MRCWGDRNSAYASSTSTTVSVGTRRRKFSSATADSTVPVGLCGRQITTTRASSAASAIWSRSWNPLSSSGIATDCSRAMRARMG